MKRETTNPKPATQKTSTPTTPPGYRPEPKVPDSVKRGDRNVGNTGSEQERARR